MFLSQIGLRLDKKWREQKLHRISSELIWCNFFSEILNQKFPVMTKNTSHTISIYGKMLVIHFSCNSIRTENCMKGLWLVFFSYMEIVWLAFFHKPKIMIFYILISQNFVVVFVTEHKWHKPWLLTRSNQQFGLLALRMHWKQPDMCFFCLRQTI